MPILHKGKGGHPRERLHAYYNYKTNKTLSYNARPGGGARGVQRVSAAAMYPTNVPLLLP